MKSLLIISLFFLSTLAYSQGMNIKWNDSDGREFAITTNGEFSYGAIQGDRIQYDYEDRIYKVGDVRVEYDYEGRVYKVGGCRVSYDYQGRVDGTRGQVN